MFEQGKSVYQKPTLQEIKSYVKQQIDCMWDEMKRFDHPHKYYVDLSQELYDLKQDMLKKQSVSWLLFSLCLILRNQT